MAQGNHTGDRRWGPGESFKTGSTAYATEKETYAEWLACPQELRDPQTKTALAEALGVTKRTLTNWAKEPAIVAKVAQTTGRFVKVEFIPEIVHTLKQQATDPSNPRSVSAAKLLLDFAERRADAAPVELGEMTDQQLVELAEEMYDRFKPEDKTA